MRKVYRIIPVGKDYFWGGSRLADEFGKQMNIYPLAESWECSTHPDGISFIDNSEEIVSLKDFLTEHPEYLGKNCCLSGELPIIVKFIDARDRLSIQVHPNDCYAKRLENQKGKDEFWYILDCADDAEIFIGFERRVTPRQLRTFIKNKTIERLLHRIRSTKDTCYYIPAGTIHGIGKGNLLVEIQQSSNVTYRLYDYDRTDLYEKKRELQIEKAIAVLDFNKYHEGKKNHDVQLHFDGYSMKELCDARWFKVRLISINESYRCYVSQTTFFIYLCIDGEAEIIDVDESTSISIRKGETVFIPADDGGILYFCGRAKLLQVFL